MVVVSYPNTKLSVQMSDMKIHSNMSNNLAGKSKS